MKLLVRLRRLACRNQPGEKSEFKIRREADAQPSQWRTTMSKASRQQQGKKDATLNAKAPQRQARGSHRPQGEFQRSQEFVQFEDGQKSSYQLAKKADF